MANVVKKWIQKLTSRRLSASTWVLYFSEGQVTGLKAKWDPVTDKVHLLSKFSTLCPLNDLMVAKKALGDQGITKNTNCIILAAPEDCSVALIDTLSVLDDEAHEALRYKMVDRVEFEITDAILETQKAPGSEDFGLQKPSWWAAMLNPKVLKNQLRILDALGAQCSVVDAIPFVQRNLSLAGAEKDKAKALLCVGKEFGSLTFSANGSLLFHKQLEWSESQINLAEKQLWERLELDLLRNLDYFDRRLAAVVTADVCFVGMDARHWSEVMSPKMPMPTAFYDWDFFFVDECQALDPRYVGLYMWSAGAALRLRNKD